PASPRCREKQRGGRRTILRASCQIDMRSNRGERHSILKVNAGSYDRYRATIAVVGGICDPLVIGREPEPIGESHAVIRFENVFGRIVRKLPIADEDAETASRKISARVIGQAVCNESQSEHILRPAPAGASKSESDCKGLVDLGKLVS